MTLQIAPTGRTARRNVAPVSVRPERAGKAPAPFTLAHFRAWASDLILDTNESWHPEPFQEAFAEDLFAGYPENWLLVPEGNGKTTLLAGLALYHCEFRPFAVVPVAAASREQAEILYRQAEGFVLRSDRMYASVHSPLQAAKGKLKTNVPRFVCLEGHRRINHHEGGRIQIFSADDRTGDGIIPTLGIIDEPHRLPNLSLYRTWSGKLAKRAGQLAAISTSGEPGGDFEETRHRIRESSTDTQSDGSFTRYVSKRIVLHEWALPIEADPEDFDAVKAANPFSGITPLMLAEKYNSPTMTMHHWLRFVCNRPTMNEDVWLGPNSQKIWDDLKQPYTLEDHARSWIGVDVALRHDTTAVVIIQRRPDGRYHAECRIWYPTDDKPIDVTDVMAHIRVLAAKYKVEAVSFDPKFFDVPAKMLSDEQIPMFEVTQSVSRMTQVIGGLYEALHRGQITHNDDRQFTNQVLNAVPRFSDLGFTLQKEKSRGKIDAAIALALAYDQALRHEQPFSPPLPVWA